jgi:phage protein D
MTATHPAFQFTIGQTRITSREPFGGPMCITVERDMNIAADAVYFAIADRCGIQLDDDVSVSMGNVDATEVVFVGNVKKLDPRVDITEIRAVGKMDLLLNCRTASVYENLTVGDIANDLISQAGLQGGAVDSGPILPRYVIDKRISAFGHMKRLADSLGYELYTNRDGQVMFHALGNAAGLDAQGVDSTAAIMGTLEGTGETYHFGQHLIEAVTSQKKPSWEQVTVGSESPMSGQGDTTAHWLTTNDTDFIGQAGNDGTAHLVFDSSARTKDLADRFAAGLLAVSARKAHEISIRILGRPGIDLGDTVSTADFNDPLSNGTGYVRSIRHHYSAENGFFTDLGISLGHAQP